MGLTETLQQVREIYERIRASEESSRGGRRGDGEGGSEDEGDGREGRGVLSAPGAARPARLCGADGRGGDRHGPPRRCLAGAMKKTLYLANPYGFSAQQRAGPLPELVRTLESMGADVWEPRSPVTTRSTGRVRAGRTGSGRPICGTCARPTACSPWSTAVRRTRASWWSLAWRSRGRKPVFLFRDDFRRCTDSEDYPLNLMLFAGLPAAGWEAAWYSSIEELAEPGKARARWLRHDWTPGPASVEATPNV